MTSRSYSQSRRVEQAKADAQPAIYVKHFALGALLPGVIAGTAAGAAAASLAGWAVLVGAAVGLVTAGLILRYTPL